MRGIRRSPARVSDRVAIRYWYPPYWSAHSNIERMKNREMSTQKDCTTPFGARSDWRTRRALLERGKAKHTPVRVYRRRYLGLFDQLVGMFGQALKLVGLFERGRRNALAIELHQFDVALATLPAPFDGFRIMQISDLHLDGLPGLCDAICRLIDQMPVDVCVLTGDYCEQVTAPIDHILAEIGRVVAAVSSRHGVLAILGNHDRAETVEAFEGLGVRFLVNETYSLTQGGAQIHITGTDDVHYFYTDAARAALTTAPDGCKIALVHSAEMADVAADSGFDLYLAGHTHGGQISLPGGVPVFTHLTRFRRYARGLWRHGAMVGYTSVGVGVSGLPVRFNTRGEVALITLRRSEPAGS